MAKGDIVANNQEIADDATLDIRPTTGEWDIHNIFHADSVELYWSDGTNDILFNSASGKGAYVHYIFEVKNGHFIRVKNVSGSAARIGYSGKQVST